MILELPGHRRQRQTLPLLVQEERILRAAVVRAESVELRVVVELNPGAVRSRRDARVQDAGRASNSAVDLVVRGALNVGRLRDVEDIGVTIQRG